MADGESGVTRVWGQSVLGAGLLAVASLIGGAHATETPAELPPAAAAPAEGIEPAFVRPLLPVETGRNDGNPVWSPSGQQLAVERARGDRKEILLVRPDGTLVETLYLRLSEPGPAEQKLFLPGLLDETSYNAGMAWSPNGQRLAFMSNGGEGNYDLYLREADGRTVRLTDHREKDGQVDWSPVADQLVFVSGRSGKGDLYLVELPALKPRALTHGSKPFLYPQWSPDGRRIVMIHGANENHDIYLIGDIARPGETLRALTSWSHDDLRPVWSPDGRQIAFYSNYNPQGDSKEWSILVVAADGSDPTHGPGLAARVVATDVVPDVDRGPAWLPDSRRIAYVKNARHEYNPIHIVDTETKTSTLLRTDTRMNHDITAARDGTLAFRAQVDQWDQIFLARLKE